MQIWPVAHFFWGYSITLSLLLLIIWLATRDVKVSNLGEFFKKRGIISAVGGFWAMIPDIDYFLEEPVFKSAAWTNVFFFHTSLDKVLPETDLFFAAEIMLFFAVVNVFAIAVTVESFKRLGEAIFGKKEEEDEEEEEEGVEKEKQKEEANEDKDEDGIEEAEPKNEEKVKTEE